MKAAIKTLEYLRIVLKGWKLCCPKFYYQVEDWGVTIIVQHTVSVCSYRSYDNENNVLHKILYQEQSKVVAAP